MRYVFHNQLTRPIDDELQAVFPAEQARAAELFAAGTLEQLYVAVDFSQAWLIVRSESAAEAEAAIQSLPLARFFTSVVTPLADLS